MSRPPKRNHCPTCIYIYTYTVTHTYTHTHIHTYTHAHIHTYTHTHIHTYTHTHIHTYTHTHIHTYTHIVFMHTYLLMYIHCCIESYIRTVICQQPHLAPPRRVRVLLAGRQGEATIGGLWRPAGFWALGLGFGVECRGGVGVIGFRLRGQGAEGLRPPGCKAFTRVRAVSLREVFGVGRS